MEVNENINICREKIVVATLLINRMFNLKRKERRIKLWV